MSVYGLYTAYGEWRKTPGLNSFIRIYKTGFGNRCRWSTPRKLLTVVINLITGKYERFYKYYADRNGGGGSERQYNKSR